MRRTAGLAIGLLALAGCGSEPSGPEEVGVVAGAQEVSISPTQACVDGEGRRYSTTPPILEVSPDTTIRLTVPESVAENGWSVQVFDEQLEEQLGAVDVERGQTVFDEINSSDVVPPAFYLVVVEAAGVQCDGFSGAWPVGFIRAGGAGGGTASPDPAG